ncbi:MAG: YbaK/EbsC family protein, partial [Synergistaceae bacterium]|nr:YbaK/EbsC family protein [Synergistaceae bacterium]
MFAPDIIDPVGKVRAFLEASGCEARVTQSEETIFTVEDASRTVDVPPEQILKSLLFITEEGEWALALMSGSNKVNDKKVKRALDTVKVRMGTAEAIRAFSGFEPGGVPPVGYPGPPRALLDSDLFQYDAVWSAA